MTVMLKSQSSSIQFFLIFKCDEYFTSMGLKSMYETYISHIKKTIFLLPNILYIV